MAVLQDPNGAVFAIGRFTEIDDPNDWPDRLPRLTGTTDDRRWVHVPRVER